MGSNPLTEYVKAGGKLCLAIPHLFTDKTRRLELQVNRTLAENMADLPTGCDWGGKRNSKGKTEFWCGYKLHLSLGDGGVPLAAILSSASLHDSQAAIPLMQMASERTKILYDLAN